MWWLYILLGIPAFFIIASFAIVIIMFRGALCRRPEDGKSTVDTASLMPAFAPFRDQIRRDREWYYAQPRRTVSIKSRDGLTLYADVLEAENAVATVLLMHGYRGSGASDFAMVLPFYHKHGINIVCPDQRACGRSEGKYVTLGAKERYDCLDWLNFIGREFGPDLPIIMDGVSMGAATILMTAGLDIPKNVKGIIADCGFTSPWEVVCSVLKATKAIPVFPFAWFAKPVSRILAGFSLTEVSATDAMKVCKVPIFFAHGKKDRFVPYEMSVKNYEACVSDKEFFTVEEAEHGMCFLLEQAEYERRILAFFEKCFGFQKAQ
jgi:pimeloyl-ACP methyl ester carboxylesterase